MPQQPEQDLKIFPTNPSFQLRLADILSHPPSSLAFPSGLALITIREGSLAEVLFCDSKFSLVENSIAVNGVGSIRDIRVHYDAKTKRIRMLYRTGSLLQFYSGAIPTDRDSIRRSTLVVNESASAPFNQPHNILCISEILAGSAHDFYSLITVASGKSYLVRFADRKLTIQDTNPEGNIYGLFKTIIKPFFRNNPRYEKCQSYLHPQTDTSSLYTLSLNDKTLRMKFFNLGSQNSNQELNSWAVDLANDLPYGCDVLSCIFKPEDHAQREYGVNLILVCNCQGKIDVFILSIDLNTRIKRVESISNIFNLNNKQLEKEAMQDEYQAEQVIQFNPQTDYLQTEQVQGRIYVVYHRKVSSTSSVNNKRYMLVIVSRVEDKLDSSVPKMINIGGQLRMVKTQLQTQGHNLNLLLIGEAYCYCFEPRSSSMEQEQDDRPVSNRNMFSSRSEGQRNRTIPPVPSFHQGVSKSMENQQRQLVSSSRIRQSASIPDETVFDAKRIQKYIFSKNYNQLFNLLNWQRNKFLKQLEDSSVKQICQVDPQRIPRQLKSLVLLKLFTLRQQGLNLVLNQDLIKYIFSDRIMGKYKERGSEEFYSFISDLFLKTNEQLLSQVYHQLFQNKSYKPIYNACVETIPNFATKIFNKLQQQLGKEMREEDSGMLLELLKQNFASSYLQHYQKLMTILLGNYMQLQAVPLHKPTGKARNQEVTPNLSASYQQFSEYNYKQLMDKYLQMINLTAPAKPTNETRLNNEPMLAIVKMFLNKFAQLSKFLCAMAIQHRNISLFDYLIRDRLVTRDNVRQFVDRSLSTIERDQVYRLFINLVKAEIEHMGKDKSIKNLNLQILSWIPSAFVDSMFQYLMDNYPKIGIIYGLTIKTRRQVATCLIRNMGLLDPIKQASTLAQILQPLYNINVQGNKLLKANIDLATMLASNGKNFIPYHQIISPKRSYGNVEISKVSWPNTKARLSNYLSEEEIQELESKFSFVS